MEPDHKDLEEAFSHAGGQCDESKCVSFRRDNFGIIKDEESACYGFDPSSARLSFQSIDNLLDVILPMMCADGFIPKVIDDELTESFDFKNYKPPVAYVAGDDDYMYIDAPLSMDYIPKNAQGQYFTCCEPHLQESHTTNISRHCSDPIKGKENDTINICAHQGAQKYPRKTKRKNQFLCCDYESTDAKTSYNFLDDVECVPYRNNNFDPCYFDELTFLRLGRQSSLSCDVPKFPYPRLLGNTTFEDYKVLEIGHGGHYFGPYQCCKHGPSQEYIQVPSPQHSGYFITIQVELCIYVFAAIVSAIVAIALLIPLRKHLVNRKGAQQRRRQRDKTSCYSTYNLYLVYLAIPDLAFALFRTTTILKIILTKDAVYDYFLQVILIMPYVGANLWINAIVAHHIMAMLKSSRAAQRIDPPSLMSINLQGFGVLFSWAMVPFKYSFNREYMRAPGSYFLFFCLFPLLVVLPIVYVLSVSLLIWKHGYLSSRNSPDSVGERGTRALAFYFFRIIFVFLGIWIPSLGLFLYSLTSRKDFYWTNFVFLLAPAIQAILSTSMVLTKPDVKKYVLDLVTLSYCFGGCGDTGNNRGNQSRPTRKFQTTPTDNGSREKTSQATTPEPISATVDRTVCDSNYSLDRSCPEMAPKRDTDSDGMEDCGHTDADPDPEAGKPVYRSKQNRDRGIILLRTGEMLLFRDKPTKNNDGA